MNIVIFRTVSYTLATSERTAILCTHGLFSANKSGLVYPTITPAPVIGDQRALRLSPPPSSSHLPLCCSMAAPGQGILLGSAGALTTPMFSFISPTAPSRPTGPSVRDWSIAQATSLGRLFATRARVDMGDVGHLSGLDELPDNILMKFGAVVVEEMKRACLGKVRPC